jgi:hypothetical protein
MHPEVFCPGGAAAIAEEAGERIEAAGLEFASEDVLCHAPFQHDCEMAECAGRPTFSFSVAP